MNTSLSPESDTAAEIARLLRLEPLDREGGYFRRTAEAAAIDPGSGRRAWSLVYSLIPPYNTLTARDLTGDGTGSIARARRPWKPHSINRCLC